MPPHSTQRPSPGEVRGTLVHEALTASSYRIDGAQHLPPFLMSVVSASDHWLFLSSTGGLTCGRVNAQRALLPYETDDRLHLQHGVTGPLTLVRARLDDGRDVLWEVFDDRALPASRERRIHKSTLGTRVTLEEADHSLGLTLSQTWATSERFGFVRSLALSAAPGSRVVEVEVLDGLLDVLPALVPLAAQQTSSTLVDAYKRSERVGRLATYSMEARLSDRAAASEALRAHVVWSTGTAGAGVLLSATQVRAFREGGRLTPESLVTGRRGAYLLHFPPRPLTASAPLTWRVVADVEQSAADVEALWARLDAPGEDLDGALDADIEAGDEALLRLVASADGVQHTHDAVATAHHFANTLFNVMRGGVFEHGHHVSGPDVARFVAARSRALYGRHEAWLATLATIEHRALLSAAETRGDPQLVRVLLEYLPLTFSRRHGDPSRPWNRFDIRVRAADGSRVLDYQGNWRDIFQNWEPLGLSFPSYVGSMIARFVSATTVDGFNPYRVTRDGIDWEAPEPDNPWANLGYWGDHQVAYLVRLLEAQEALEPGLLRAQLGQRHYGYADVPYRLRPYAELVRDPKDTITFDHAAHHRALQRQAEVGADGAYVWSADGEVLRVTLLEKLLVPALSKLSNLVVGGGIWLNTQRPEWNDANNALVGTGVSVVTLSYLRRYLAQLAQLIPTAGQEAVSREVLAWLRELSEILTQHQACLAEPVVDDRTRRAVLDALGLAFERYRTAVYTHGLSSAEPLPHDEVHRLLTLAQAYADHTLRANRRGDGLYHAYNLLGWAPGEARLTHLYEMLEGQVAILSAGLLSSTEAADVLDALAASPLYRADQDSYVLYPVRARPSFLDKNRVPAALSAQPLVAALLAAGDRSVLEQDARGHLRFAGDLTSARDVAAALARLSAQPRWRALVESDGGALLEAWEETFRHHEFTGRSGTMHKYEGLGCIYWHMVAKLLLAVQEQLFVAHDGGEPAVVVERLRADYLRIQRGLGYHKSPAQWGAFPTDPYSHTPLGMGAQQPGMTGQVKEELLTRRAELGLRLRGGQLVIDPLLLSPRELGPARTSWPEYGLELPPHALGYTLAGVPVIVRAGADSASVRVVDHDGEVAVCAGLVLGREATERVLRRDGSVARVEVELPWSLVRPEVASA